MIDVHYVGTPNGYKVAIMLEELGCAYSLIAYDLFAGDHLTAAFRALNPNNKLPVIVNSAPDDGETPFVVFETGAILLYLAEKYGMFLPEGARARSTAIQWLMWQKANLGPMAGQAHHFVRYAAEDQTYGVERYRNETLRLMHVLDHRLGEAAFLANSYSIADIATWPWVQGMGLLGIDIAKFSHVSRWS